MKTKGKLPTCHHESCKILQPLLYDVTEILHGKTNSEIAKKDETGKGLDCAQSDIMTHFLIHSDARNTRKMVAAVHDVITTLSNVCMTPHAPSDVRRTVIMVTSWPTLRHDPHFVASLLPLVHSVAWLSVAAMIIMLIKGQKDNNFETNSKHGK